MVDIFSVKKLKDSEVDLLMNKPSAGNHSPEQANHDTSLFQKERTRIAIIGILLSFLFSSAAFADDPPNYDDPFYKQKGANQLIEERRLSSFQQVNESVDPFTGNVNLHHTDVILPGNGGLDLKIQRSYNSRIWGRRDFPTLVAASEASVMGIGWSFHFGRVVNPGGTGSSNGFLPNNPVIEMPDGSQHPAYLDKNNLSQMITREQWIYKQISTSPLIYQLTLTDGTVYTFPTSNAYFPTTGATVYQVSTITTTNNNTITFNYDPSDKRILTSIADTAGRSVTFGYSTLSGSGCPGGFLTKALTSMSVNGKTYTYSYVSPSSSTNCLLFLASATPPVGPSWNYGYTFSIGAGQFELVSVTYPTGANLTYGYSDVSFDIGPGIIPFTVVTSRSLSGRGLSPTTWNYSYSAGPGSNQVTTVTQSGCKTERYTYASFGPLPDSGVVTQLWKIGSLLSKEILDGGAGVQTETYAWTPSAAISDDDLPNGNWNLQGGVLSDDQIFVPRLGSKTWTRDGKTYTTSYSNYDAYGNPQAITESGDASRTTSLTYFSNTTKNIVKDHPASQAVTVSGQTFTTNYTYDSNTGNLTVLNRYGVSTGFGYSNGNVSSRTNARNFTTNYQYNFGTVSQINNPIYSINRSINWEGTIASEQNGRGLTTSFSYDGLNRLAQITPPSPNVGTSVSYDNSGAASWTVTRGSASTQFSVDGIGRVISTAATGNINTQSSYNTCGQKTYQSYPYGTSNIGDSFTYDVLNRVTRVTHPDNTSQIYSYANGNVAITNERSVTVTYGYVGFGNPDEKRLTSVADATGTTSYGYNAVGSLTSIIHPGGLQRIFSYDSRNFLTGETHPETGGITYVPDPVGNVSSKTDGKGITSFIYDPLNRLTNINYPNSTDNTIMGYDNADNRGSMSSSAASFTYTYDAENRLQDETTTIGSVSRTTSYRYDSQGNLISLSYPASRALSYTYDSANRVTGLAGYISGVTYHPSGGMDQLTYANGKVTAIGYDNRYRVKTLNSSGVLGLTYNYDGVSNVTSIVDGLNSSRNRSMTYDTLDRLSTASGVWGSMSFSGYDALGNRGAKTVNSSTTSYAYQSNRLISAGGASPDSYNYDANGNITSIRGFTLTYDFANRLTTVNNGTVSYTYDGDGKRIKKINTATGKTTLYFYDRAGNVITESDANGVPQIEYLYINGQLVARIIVSIGPPIISAVTATTTATAATITWTTNIGADSQVEYGTTTAYGSSTALNSNLVTAHNVSLSGLSQSTLYHYRVKSRNVAGVLAVSDSTFTTTAPPPPDTTPPSTPSLSLNSNCSFPITVTWTLSTDNVGVHHYEIWKAVTDPTRCPLSGCGPPHFSLLVTTPATTYADSARPTFAAQFIYKVRALDAAGNASGHSNTVTRSACFGFGG